jgi:hypothetical protein
MLRQVTMSDRARFLAGLVLGTAGALLFGGGGPWGLGLLVLVSLPLGWSRDGLAYWSGLCLAFGLAWLVLLARQSSSSEDLRPWVEMGIAAVALGVVALALHMALRMRRVSR